MVKKILVFLVAVLVIIQFFHPKKNESVALPANSVAAVFAVPDSVKKILAVSCNDCHSGHTVYPWYSKIQPVDWWLNNHINEGKKELDFDEFASYRPRRQYKKMEEIIKQVKEDEMPLNSYTWIHKDAILTADQKQALITWAEMNRTLMEQKYPRDSLIRKK